MNKTFAGLRHVQRPLPQGGFVLVLDTGAEIEPEAVAMLQALHSRSLGGIHEHLKTLSEKGYEKFMSMYYVGYNHKSIGDCGTTTIFIEGVSMLAAKAVQDWMLYSGQEASTRYIDFSSQPMIDPVATDASNRILEDWRAFYLRSQEPLKEHLRETYPRVEDEKESVYEKAIAARSFDILRGFLPVGASTKLSWHTNLRQAADHLMLLRHHALEEVRHIADALDKALQEAYPSSFGHKRYEHTEDYYREWMAEDYYLYSVGRKDLHIARDGIDKDYLRRYKACIARRPPKTELPKQIAEAGTMTFEYVIDFGSFRDIQRQRSVIQRMPLVSERLGMHPWYYESLPGEMRARANALVARQVEAIGKLDATCEVSQYYYPLGMLVPCRLTGDLAALVYIVELRAQATVHPTLHELALRMAGELANRYRDLGLVLHVDRDMGRFTVKRGLQDITVKG